MSGSVFHILNGDALANRFPESIEGIKVIMRACLMDTDFTYDADDTLLGFFTRMSKIRTSQNWVKQPEDYLDYVFNEIRKIEEISDCDEVYFWFEKDVFCQVNFWFLCNSLLLHGGNNNCFLVTTDEKHPYSFAHHSNEDLLFRYKNTSQHIDLNAFAMLWQDFSSQYWQFLKIHSDDLIGEYNFLEETIPALLDCVPNNQGLNGITSKIVTLSKNHDTQSFPDLFRLFCEHHPVYGLGDVQFRGYYDQLFNQ